MNSTQSLSLLRADNLQGLSDARGTGGITFNLNEVVGSALYTYVTNIDVTNASTGPLPSRVVDRVLSLYFLSRLNEDGLSEACRTLYDIFDFHSKPKIMALPTPIARVATLKAARQVPAAQLVFEDD